jgi:hypothetical protein
MYPTKALALPCSECMYFKPWNGDSYTYNICQKSFPKQGVKRAHFPRGTTVLFGNYFWQTV